MSRGKMLCRFAMFLGQFISNCCGDFASISGAPQFRPDWPRVKHKIVCDEVDVYDRFGE